MPLTRLRNLLKSAAPKLFPYAQAKAVKKLTIPTKPRVSKYQSVSLAQRLFSLQTSRSSTFTVKEVDSYKDRNFLIKGTIAGLAHDETEKTSREKVYVLKVLNSVCSRNPDLISTISDVLFDLNSNGIQCPVPQASIFDTYHVPCRLLKKRLDGGEILGYKSPEFTQDRDCCETFELVSDVCDLDDVYIIRMLSFVPGQMLCDVEVKWSVELLVSLGMKMAHMHKIFKEFSDSKNSRSLEGLRQEPFEWDLRNVPDVLDLCFHALEDDGDKQATVKEIATQFQNHVLPNIGKLDNQLIHGDLNAHNIIVQPNAEGNDFEIEGFIDFDHLHYSNRVFDVAISLAYVMLESESHGLDPIEAANHVLAGYQSEFPLSSLELGMILKSVMARISISISMGAYNCMHNTFLDKDYVLYTAKRGWKVIDHLLKIDPGDDNAFDYE